MFFRRFFGLGYYGFRALFKSPYTLFIYGILSKWYVLFTVTSIVVTYWVLKGLDEAGILSNIESTIFKSFGEVKAVAKYCTKHIGNLSNFWECVNNIPEYIDTKEEKELMQILQNQLNYENDTESIANPYK